MKALFKFVDSARQADPSISDLADYARALAASGDVLTPPTDRRADLSSTGGPASLSTLLCPLHLVALGWQVPKLGVVGRPAGGLDVMARIPGYRTDFGPEKFLAVLAQCGYANAEAGGCFAPADAETFKYRQSVGLQANGSLAAASILAKKLATGVVRAGLDIRVAPHGNFGPDLQSALTNAQLFTELARQLDIEAACYVHDARQPLQPYIGRAEALLAMRMIFENRPDPWLKRHADVCLSTSVDLAGASSAESPTDARIAELFAEHVTAQGGNLDEFRRLTEQVLSKHVFEIRADQSGFVVYDLACIRMTLVRAQSQRGGRIPDPAGLILKAEPGAFVRKGDLIMTARIEDDSGEEMHRMLTTCVGYGRSSPLIAEVVRA